MEETKKKELEDLGFNLFPLRVKAKEPIPGLNWKQYQSEKYTGVFPDNCNIAVICGAISNNTFVVDLDDMSIYDDLPDWMKETYTVETGKGKHLYYHYHGFPPANKKLDDFRGRHIDIKSEGGYVLAAGSTHPSGRKYKVVISKPIMEMEIPKLKETLEELGFHMESQSLEELKEGVAEGGRDDATFKLACYFVREGLFGEALRYEVEKMNSKNKPPLPQRDIDRIIEQASKYEIKHTKSHIKEAKQIQEEMNREPEELKIQNIDPKIHEDIPIRFDAIITAVGERKTYTKWAKCYCPEDDCDNGGKFYCNDLYQFSIPKCKKHKVKMYIEEKETAYIQQLMIEEFLEEARNSDPIKFEAEIIDDNVGEAFMGQRKNFLAKFRSVPDKDGRNIILFQIMEMNDIEQQEGCLPEPEEVQSWLDCENFFDRVTASIIPDLMMDVDIIQSAILWGATGSALNGKRDLIHLAFIGDAQLGKSELAIRMHKLLVGSGMTVGGKTSGAGLTIGMVKTHNGMMMPRAGFFPQYTGHHTIIDEADKMTQSDQDSCLEVMEQRTATLTKVGIPSMTLSAECPLLICGNPKGGKFNDKYPAILDNFNMTIPYISRFDQVWCMQDKNDPDLDSKIRKFIRSFEKRKEQYMSEDELQRYFNYIQTLDATIPESLMNKVDELHARMRPLNTGDGLPIGWRQYYGLYRLITASAKAHLRKEATEEDFELIERLIGSSLKSMRMDIKTGKVGKIKPEKMTKDKTVLETWNECMDESKTVDREEFVEALGNKEPFNLLSAGQRFTDMITNGRVKMNNDTERYYLA